MMGKRIIDEMVSCDVIGYMEHSQKGENQLTCSTSDLPADRIAASRDTVHAFPAMPRRKLVQSLWAMLSNGRNVIEDGREGCDVL